MAQVWEGVEPESHTLSAAQRLVGASQFLPVGRQVTGKEPGEEREAQALNDPPCSGTCVCPLSRPKLTAATKGSWANQPPRLHRASPHHTRSPQTGKPNWQHTAWLPHQLRSEPVTGSFSSLAAGPLLGREACVTAIYQPTPRS